MPADYVACRDSYVKKGVSLKTAKARCAAWFYKKHGYTVNEAHKKGQATAESPLPPELQGEDLSEVDWNLVEYLLKDLPQLEELATTQSAKPTKNTTDAISYVVAINTEFLADSNVVEIVATKVGAKAYTGDGVAVVWTPKALEKAQNSWVLGKVSLNHEDDVHGRIIASFMDGDLLRMVVKVSDTLKDWIVKASDLIGVSIEAMNVKINKALEIVSAKGTGVTFVFPPHEPACTIKEGCGIVAIKDEKVDEVYSFVPPEAGTLPEEGKKILKKVYDECRAGQKGSEDPADKEKCAKIAWSAVKNAGFSKEGAESEWSKGSLTMTANIPGDAVTVLGSNTVTANTVNTYEVPIIKTWWDWQTVPWTTAPSDAPINIVEKDKNSETPVKGENMAEETKEVPKTICAEKHDRLMKEKDDAIAALNKEIESLKATVSKYEDEKRARLLDTLKSEGVDTEVYKADSIPVIEKVISAVQAFKKKEESKPEVNSGAVIVATETKTEPQGNAMSAALDKAAEEAKLAAEADKKKLDDVMARAKSMGY